MIVVNLDVMMAKRKMSSMELSEKLGITPANLSILKTNKGKAIRFSTLDKLCEILDCTPQDILEYRKKWYKTCRGGRLYPFKNRKKEQTKCIL